MEFIAKEIILLKEGKFILQKKISNILDIMKDRVCEVSIATDEVYDI